MTPAADGLTLDGALDILDSQAGHLENLSLPVTAECIRLVAATVRRWLPVVAAAERQADAEAECGDWLPGPDSLAGTYPPAPWVIASFAVGSAVRAARDVRP